MEEEHQGAQFRLLGGFTGLAKDPGKAAHSAEGVRAGVGVRLPRLPAFYQKKKKVREQEDLEKPRLVIPKTGTDNGNYKSGQELEETVLQQLELFLWSKKQVKKHTDKEARELCGDKLVIASLCALVKSGSRDTGDLTVRLLFGGTIGGSNQPRDRSTR